LFGVPPQQVEVRPSAEHRPFRREYLDGSVLAQLGSPDMRTRIAHALAWPDRIASGVEFLDLVRTARLDFRAPDPDKFPCLALGAGGGTAGGLTPPYSMRPRGCRGGVPGSPIELSRHRSSH